MRSYRQALPATVGATVQVYCVEMLFRLGTKPGETPHDLWGCAGVPYSTLEEARELKAEGESDGMKARIVLITVAAEVVE